MGNNLMVASNQWASRPDDERFSSLEELHAFNQRLFDEAREAEVDQSDIRVEAVERDLRLVGRAGIAAALTNWSFGQLCGRIGAPAQYLATLPSSIAMQPLNWGLKATALDSREQVKLLFRINGAIELRGLTSTDYSRIWNRDLTERLFAFTSDGWRVPPARPCRENQKGSRIATAADVLEGNKLAGLSINVGDTIAPAGLYASDRDMFVFLVNESRLVDDGKGNTLARGFFLSNSEVGNNRKLKLTRFLYAHVCGNHIIWDARDVAEVSVVHVGAAPDRAFGIFDVELRKYSNESTADDAARIVAAQTKRIAATKQEVLDVLFGMRGNTLPLRTLEAGLDVAEKNVDRYGDPLTVWGVANGLTQHSQTVPFADKRTEIDRAAGKVLRMAF